MTIAFSLFNIGTFSGIGSIFILALQFLMKRYTVFQYFSMQNEQCRLLCLALCKAELEGYRFIITGKDIAVAGHTQNNAWLKPYKCYPNIYTRATFPNADEVYCYKLDRFLLLMIKIAIFFRCKTIIKADLSMLEKLDKKHPMGNIEFFKNKFEAESAYKKAYNKYIKGIHNER